MVQEPRGRVERRLSAILAADVAGYSRLMHSDEEATHAKLTALLADAVEPAIAEHGGRIVKNTGDGCLAEFECGRSGSSCFAVPDPRQGTYHR
jgi:adenylate cyclase